MKDSPFKDINEESIIPELLKENHEVLKWVYTKYYAQFMAWGKRMFPNFPQDEILDSFHTTFLILVQNVQSGKLKILESSLKTYLFAIARNQLLKKNQLNKNLSEINLNTESKYNLEDSEDDIWAKERQAITQTLPNMGENCEKILYLLMFEGKSLDEVRQIMGYNDNQEVSKRKYRCLEQLKRKMNEFMKS